MQVSIYLKEELVKRVDRIARKEHRSRSKIIEALVESSLTKARPANGLDSLVGAWEDDRSAAEIIREIYGDRQRNRRSERAGL